MILKIFRTCHRNNKRVARWFFYSLLLVLVACTATSEPTNYRGSVPDNKALLLLNFDAAYKVGVKSGGLHHYVGNPNPDQPVMLVVDPGEITISKVLVDSNIADTDFKSIQVAAGSITYLGDLLLDVNLADRKVGMVVLDHEDQARQYLEHAHPLLIKKRQLSKQIMTSTFSDYGNPSEYSNLPIPQPSATDAIVVLYRNGSRANLIDQIANTTILMNGRKVAGLSESQYTYLRVKPGKYAFAAGTGLLQVTTAENTHTVEPGNAYVIELNMDSVFKRVPISQAVPLLMDRTYKPASEDAL